MAAGLCLGTQGTETEPDHSPQCFRGKGGSPSRKQRVALHDLDPAVLGGMLQMQ